MWLARSLVWSAGGRNWEIPYIKSWVRRIVSGSDSISDKGRWLIVWIVSLDDELVDKPLSIAMEGRIAAVEEMGAEIGSIVGAEVVGDLGLYKGLQT